MKLDLQLFGRAYEVRKASIKKMERLKLNYILTMLKKFIWLLKKEHRKLKVILL